MTPAIETLDERTVSQIAAGEVVERPASVAKELVENSLDAGASHIDVSVEAGGAEFLQVADDGVGMTQAGAEKAIEQHTTSKIRDIEDLETDLSTLGFRGEALYTIGAVSRMTITTRPRDGGDVGTEIRVVGGDVESVGPAGRAPGTTVTVADLFFNKPARRKFLKTDATEFAHVNRVVTRYALANPDVAISLDHDDATVFSTTGRGDLQETIHAVYGREVAEAMVPVEASPKGRIDAIGGYVSEPETTRSASEYVATFVNGRYVRAGILREAVVSAYEKQLAPDRFPFAVLFLEVPPDSVDVNVHPRKLDVRFDDEASVSSAVETAVKEALLDHGLIRSGAPRGRSAPSETSVEPGGEAPGEDGDGPSAGRPRTAEGETGDDDASDRLAGRGGSDVPASAREDASRGGRFGNGPAEDDPAGEPSDEAASGETTDSDAARGDPNDRGDAGRSRRDDGKFRTDPPQAGLGEDDSSVGRDADPAGPTFSTLPPLDILGQLRDTYIVAESPDGLVLIDQHAADERIAYERLARRVAEQRTSQRLVSPVRVEVTPQEASLFDAATEDIEDLGFRATLDGTTVVVEAVPAVFAETLSPALIRDVLSSFLASPDHGEAVSSAADALLADMACYPAITGNTPLKDGDVLELLSELDDCENPYSCPHGRPVVIEIAAAELETRFERDYPGHQIRRPEE